METIERIALETGLPLWGALSAAIEQQLLQPRALAALRGFRELIEDARAMLEGTFVERATRTALNAEAQQEFAETSAAPETPNSKPETSEPEPEAVEGFRAPGGGASR